MTVMDPRPWSPASPHIGPDDEDLSMLAPTGDAEADLGSAILVVHRVGAAACESVARAPLPDEYRLIAALSNARGLAAAPAVDAVSKCVGSDNPRGYADLLLRDLFDAGEAGALAVYRACISKGVAPPLAVQRAGLVYGVDHDELGRYLTVAVDPKSHPIAIADAADRAVTRWASNLVRQELAEPVSKRTVTEYNATTLGQEHPKGQAGRFVSLLERPTQVATPPVAGQVAGRPVGLLARLRREGGGGQAAPEVAAPPVAVEVAEPVARQVRRQRKERQLRRTRQEQATQPLTSTLTSAALSSRLTAKVGAKLSSMMQAQRDQPTGEERLPVDQDYDVSQQFGVIAGIPLAWSMQIERANEIYQDAHGAGTEESPKHIKMGALQQILSEPLRWDLGQHSRSMGNIAAEAAGAMPPKSIEITRDELERAGHSPYDADSVQTYVTNQKLDEDIARDPRFEGGVNPFTSGLTGLYPSADSNGNWYLVAKPEPIVYGHPEGAPLPAAAEFVVDPEGRGLIRGNIEGGVREDRPSYELDPTQDYIIKERREVWRPTGRDTGYFIDRYTLEPLDDNFKKAAPVATQQRWRTEPRNSLGEWSRSSRGLLARVQEAEAPPVARAAEMPTPAQVRRERKQRQQRRVRATAPATNGVTSQLTGRVSAPLSAQLRSLAQSVSQEIEEERPVRSEGFPVVLDDRPIHRLLTSKQWAAFLEKYAPTSYAEDVRGIDLPGPARAAFAEEVGPFARIDGDEVNAQMRRNVIRTVDSDPENRLVEVPDFRRTIAPNDRDKMKELLVEMEEYMDRFPEVAQMTVERDIDGGPHDLRVYRNLKPVPDQVLIFAEDDIDWDRPVSLIWVGKARRDDLNRGRDYFFNRTESIDAPVGVYRAEQRTWRAHQDER